MKDAVIVNDEKPIRVAHIMGKMLGGGVESVVMNYYRHVDRDKVQFDFLVDEDSSLVPKAEIESLGGRVITIPPYQKMIPYRRELSKEFSENNWRIVHSHINALSVFPLQVAYKSGIPIRIAHSHSSFGKGEHLRNAAKIMLRQFSNVYPTHRFACSQVAGQWLFGKKTPFELVYNAIELDKFVFDVSTRKKVRASLAIEDDTFVIGHVGRLTSVKNHEFLLKAFAELCKRCSDCMLICVGNGELKDSIERTAALLGVSDKVRLLGQRSDIAELYQAFDVFALPSLYEGLCLVGVEAQRAGLPCLFSNRVSREVELTGSCEFLPIENPMQWANSLFEIKRLGDNNKRLRPLPVSFKKYDIVDQAEWLTRRYLYLFEEA